MPRREFYFAPPEDFGSDRIILKNEEHHHLARVLHHRAGDLVTVVDGQGRAAVDCEIVESGKRETILKTGRLVHGLGEPAVNIILAQSVPKGSRFDWLAEKATELGVTEILPLLCNRSEVAPGEGKIARWNRLTLAAMKQCCRSRWPRVRQPRQFDEFCADLTPETLALLAEEQATSSPAGLTGPAPSRVVIMIGPEGGFTDEEIARAQHAGCKLLNLGNRRLRSDTAGLVAVVKIMEWLEAL